MVLRDSPAVIFGEVASLVLLVAGIVVTAHNSPHVTKPAAQKQRGAVKSIGDLAGDMST